MTRTIILHAATLGLQSLLLGVSAGVLVRLALEEWAFWQAEQEEGEQIHASSSAYRPWRRS